MGISGDAGSGQLTVDTGTTGLRVLQGFDDEHGSALSKHEAVSIDVPRPRRALRLVVAAAHRLHLSKAGDRQGVDDAFGPADNDDVGAPQPDHVQAERDRLVARGAGRHRRMRPGLGPEPQADVGCRSVGHQHRDSQRANPASAFLLLDIPVGQQRDHSADAGRDGDAEPLSVDRIVLSQPVSSVVPSLQRGDDRKLRAPVEPARFDPF